MPFTHEPDPPAIAASRRSAALAAYRTLLSAWNQRDATAFAACFVADGAAIGFDGSEMTSAAAIEAELSRVFTHHRTATYVAKIRDVTDMGDAVLLRAVAGMVPPEADTINAATNALQTLVLIGAAHLRILLLQNTPAAFHERPEAREALTAELSEVLRSGETVAD